MKLLRKHAARVSDRLMCHLMNRVQQRHVLDAGSLEAFEAYVEACRGVTPQEFFAAPELEAEAEPEPGGTGLRVLRWETPRRSGYKENDRAHALLIEAHPGAPTVFMLHALGSTSDRGYRRWGRRFNEAGWSACFVHLPYHYSKVPAGCENGELAISPDLVRTGQGLRQGVTELRQVMGWLRRRGVREFGVWGTSYGGWIGALLLGVEADFRFAVLQAPIVNVHHAIWESAAARHMRKQLARVGITAELVGRHEHLTFPMRVRPAGGTGGVILAAGMWDQIVRPEDVKALHRHWEGSAYLAVEQGHFGYRMAEECFRHLVERGFIGNH